MSLANIAYSTTLTWANPLLPSLEKQIDTPLFGERPVEMGMRGLHDELIKRVRDVDVYKDLFPKAFPKDSDPFTVLNVKRAIASFERRLISGNSPYDQAVYGGKKDALSDAARRGMKLFASEKFECFHCHVGFNFQDAVFYEGKEPNRNLFHNTGLYNIGGKGLYPDENTGVHHITGEPSDMGRFRAPTLRNIEVTAPYMHDGSIKTLSDVLDHYAAGGRTIKSGPHAGVGADNPHKSFFIIGFEMTESERSDMIAFLKSLTDKTFLTDPALSDPWKK
jgi:cytochrome c peroxidase